MNRRAFRKALRYGFGRTILYLQNHDATPHRDDILEACLNSWCYDTQSEGTRAQYISEIISLTGEPEFYRSQILAAAETANDHWNGVQLFNLARIFAEKGNDQAAGVLDRGLERMPFDYRLAEHAIMLHGPDGLKRVLQLQLDNLGTDCDEIDVDWWMVEEASERWRMAAFTTYMREAGHADPRIKAAWKQIRHQKAETALARKERRRIDNLPNPTYEQVMQVLANPDSALEVTGRRWTDALRSWSKAAQTGEWERMAAELAVLPAEDPRWRRAVQYLFWKRAFPGDPGRLIESVPAVPYDRLDFYRAWTPKSQLASHSIRALSMISNPTVRSMGLEILEYSALPSHGASLLEANFEEGDLKILSGAFRKARSEHERHGIAMSIREIDKRFSPAGASSVLLMLYEHVRCGVCRKQTVERLHAHGSLPASIANECRFDAYLPLRQTIAELVPDPAAQH